jgi:hypothetical protein
LAGFAPGRFHPTVTCAGTSTAMVKRIRSALGMLLTDAMERGLVAKNVVRELRRRNERQAEKLPVTIKTRS